MAWCPDGFNASKIVDAVEAQELPESVGGLQSRVRFKSARRLP
jgi:hypothetical protein